MYRKMKRVNDLGCVLAAITAACLSVLWQAHPVQSCAGGRYGRYENWPSNNDWDELLMLITGKYGKNGWGWHQQNSYAYSSIGDYPSGALKYSSNPFDTSGSGLPSIGNSNSNGISNSGYDSGSQYNSGGGGGGSTSISKLNTDKIKEALNSFFKTKPKKASKPTSGWSSGGGGGSNIGSAGGGFVGESFIDSPGPGPPYPSHDDSPIGPGPPYNDNINIGPGPPYESGGWSDGGSGPGPSSSPFNGGPPSGGIDQSSWPGQQESRPHDYSSSGPPQTSNYNSQSQSHTSNQLYNNEQNGNSNGGGGNQFQSDYDTFGGTRGDYRKKRRRQGRRHPFSNSDEQSPSTPKQRKTHYRRVPKTAGLPTRPVLMGVESNGKRPFKFPPYPGSSGGEGGGGGGGGGARRGITRRNRRMGAPMALRRRMFNTKFGGYKVDHSRLRFG